MKISTLIQKLIAYLENSIIKGIKYKDRNKDKQPSPISPNS